MDETHGVNRGEKLCTDTSDRDAHLRALLEGGRRAAHMHDGCKPVRVCRGKLRLQWGLRTRPWDQLPGFKSQLRHRDGRAVCLDTGLPCGFVSSSAK